MTNKTEPLQLKVVPDWEKQHADYRHKEVADVAVDALDRVYLFTRDCQTVLIYSPEGEFLNAWDHVSFERPHGITVTPEGTVYCVDDRDQTIRKFDLDGKEISVIGTSGVRSDTGADWNQPNTTARMKTVHQNGGPPFNNPTRLAVAPNGDLYISDGYGNCKIHRFSPDGELLSSWGSSGSGDGEFRLPHAVAISDEGLVFVADRENDRVQVFDLDGQFVNVWNDLHDPNGIAIGPDGRVYVAESRRKVGYESFRLGVIPEVLLSRLSIYEQSGEVVMRIGDEGRLGVPGVLSSPHGIAVDSKGSVYVAESAGAAYRAAINRGDDCMGAASLPAIQKFVRT